MKNSIKIEAVVSLDNQLGKALQNIFGNNLVFITEYNSYKINGKINILINCSSKDYKDTVNFVFNNYRSSSGTASDLEIGYYANYSFFEWSSSNKKYELGKQNDEINKMLTIDSSILPLLVGCLCVVVFAFALAINISIIFKENKNPDSPLFEFLLLNWLITSVAFIFSSIMVKHNVFNSIIYQTTFISVSTLNATFIVITFVFVAILTTAVSAIFKNKSRHLKNE